jgi:hypothetical protein
MQTSRCSLQHHSDCNERIGFENVMAGAFGKRLTYSELTGARLAN